MSETPAPPAEPDRGERVREVLKGFGWELGPEFEKRYLTDPWVFNLVNIIERQDSMIAVLETEVASLRSDREGLQADKDALIEALAETEEQPGLTLTAVRWNKLVDARTENCLRAAAAESKLERLERIEAAAHRAYTIFDVLLKVPSENWNDPSSVDAEWPTAYELRSSVLGTHGDLDAALSPVEGDAPRH